MPDITKWKSFPQEDKGKVYKMRDRGPLLEIKHIFSMYRIKRKSIINDEEERIIR